MNRDVSGAEAQDLLARKDVFVLDVRTPHEFRGGALDRAMLIPVDQLERHLDNLPQDMEAPIVVYCAHGVRSVFAKSILERHGYKNVFNLKGGLAAYISGGC